MRDCAKNYGRVRYLLIRQKKNVSDGYQNVMMVGTSGDGRDLFSTGGNDMPPVSAEKNFMRSTVGKGVSFTKKAKMRFSDLKNCKI